jgi:hypothetical protein
MASWRCTGCRTVYAVGIEPCPQCGTPDHEEDWMAKASAEAGATHYVAEGDPVPGDLPPGVRLVGPGAPAVPEPDAEDEPEPVVTPEPELAAEDVSEPPEPEEPPGPSTPPESSGGSSDPDDDDGPPDYGAYRIVDLRDLCRERGLSPTGAKAELAGRLAEYDEEHG